MTGLYERQNPHRLYRDKQNAVIAGVCAGVADYFGFNRKGVRIAYGLAMLMPPFMPFAFVSYVVLAIVLPVKPEVVEQDKAQADFWRNVSNAPADVFGALNHRFKELNLRLEKMEAYVTSKEFEFDRELGAKGGRRGEAK
jgi:phage shock protein C